jgi:hypothetical protein
LITVDADFPYRSSLPTVAITIPRNWILENPMAMAAHSDSSPAQSGRFLERVEETATETLLAQIENHVADTFSGDPELMMHDWPGTTAVMPDG